MFCQIYTYVESFFECDIIDNSAYISISRAEAYNTRVCICFQDVHKNIIIIELYKALYMEIKDNRWEQMLHSPRHHEITFVEFVAILLRETP